MAAARRSGQRLRPEEITIHFDDPKASSKEILAAARDLGVPLKLTSRELDKLRQHGDDLRKWLAKDPARHEEFVRNPKRAISEITGDSDAAKAPTVRGRGAPRWEGVGRRGGDAAAGAELREWLLAKPGRMADFVKDPAAAVEAALSEHTPATRKRLAKAVKPPARTRRRKSTTRGRRERS